LIYARGKDKAKLRCDSAGASRKENMTKKHTVQFDAHKKVKLPTEVSFETKEGKEVDFNARKPTEVPVHVKFKAKDK
jgi:hypothetical protein